MKKLSILFLAFFFLATTKGSAQSDRTGQIGIGYSGNLSSYSNELGLSIFASNEFSLEPQIGFQSINIEDNSATAWKLGLGFQYRFSEFVVTPYFGARVKYNMVSGGDDTYGDLILSAIFGGEYFVTEWFSVGAEMRINYAKTDDQFSPTYDIAKADIIETEQVFNIRLYFN